MNQEALTLYKLIILYMLDRVNFPLTRTQVCDFVLERGYTTYFVLSQAIAELTDAELLQVQTVGNRTHLVITEEGRNTLSYFENRIGSAIKQEISLYFKENEVELRNDVSVLADYYKASSGEYETRLVAKDRDVNLVTLTLSVPTEEIAASICNNWQEKNQKLYQYLTKELF